MCVVSLVMQTKTDEWFQRYWYQPVSPMPVPLPPPNPMVPLPTKEEVDEFRRLLEKAREYDRKNNEPDCEMEEKRDKLRALAKELGVEIGFITAPPIQEKI